MKTLKEIENLMTHAFNLTQKKVLAVGKENTTFLKVSSCSNALSPEERVKYNGPGIEYPENATRFANFLYHGMFEHGQRNGKGATYEEGKKVFDGNFENGQRHGKGTIYENGKKVFVGIFKNGEIVEGDIYKDGEIIGHKGAVKEQKVEEKKLVVMKEKVETSSKIDARRKAPKKKKGKKKSGSQGFISKFVSNVSKNLSSTGKKNELDLFPMGHNNYNGVVFDPMCPETKSGSEAKASGLKGKVLSLIKGPKGFSSTREGMNFFGDFRSASDPSQTEKPEVVTLSKLQRRLRNYRKTRKSLSSTTTKQKGDSVVRNDRNDHMPEAVKDERVKIPKDDNVKKSERKSDSPPISIHERKNPENEGAPAPGANTEETGDMEWAYLEHEVTYTTTRPERLSDEKCMTFKGQVKAYNSDGIKVYDGGFKDGKYHGRGTVFWKEKPVYFGIFKEGKKHGRGVEKDPETRHKTFSGEFKLGLRDGKGQEYDRVTGHKTFDGQFKDGEKHGPFMTFYPKNGEKLVEVNFDMGIIIPNEKKKKSIKRKVRSSFLSSFKRKSND